MNSEAKIGDFVFQIGEARIFLDAGEYRDFILTT